MSLYTEHAFLNRPAFIVGYPKSGTTLVTAVLDGHPDLLVLPEELDFFGVIRPLMKSWRYKLAIDKVDLILNTIFTTTHMRRLATDGPQKGAGGNYDYSHIKHGEMAAAIKSFLDTEGLEERHLLPAVVHGFRQSTQPHRQGFSRWIEKTPRQEQHVMQLLEWFPGAKFIHVLRDPRDNYISYKRKHPQLTARGFSRDWLSSAKLALRHQELIGSEQHRLLCYEDFVREFEREVSELSRFLDISNAPSMREPSKLGVPWFGNSMFGRGENGSRSISTEALGRYREHENQDEIREVENSTGEIWDEVRGLAVRG